MTIPRLRATALRVECASDPSANAAIKARTDATIRAMADMPAGERERRLAALEREWDVERVLQLNASALVLLGLALAARHDRRFLALPVAVWSFLAQHAIQGWCPPLPVLRRLGVRTMREIERERYALKAMRGDFAGRSSPAEDAGARVAAVLAAVDA